MVMICKPIHKLGEKKLKLPSLTDGGLRDCIANFEVLKIPSIPLAYHTSSDCEGVIYPDSD